MTLLLFDKLVNPTLFDSKTNDIPFHRDYRERNSIVIDILKSKIELAPNILESNNLNLITCSVGI